MEKARDFQKNIFFCFIDYTEDFVWITTKGRGTRDQIDNIHWNTE